MGKRLGRPPTAPELRKESVHVRLQKWLVDWTAEQDKSRAVLIEHALIKTYKLKSQKPKADE